MSSIDESGAIIGVITPPGIVMISQTCDIVNDHPERPHLLVSPLLAVSDELAEDTRKRRRPQFGYIPELARRGFVVDLDVCATVRREAVATWERQAGCNSDEERQAFADALARHKQRFAFPNDFNRRIVRMKRWLKDRKGKDSPAGRLYDAIDHIMVSCRDWDQPDNGLEFIAILLDDPTLEQWNEFQEPLASLQAHAKEMYPNATFRLTTAEDLSVREYFDAYRLDLDNLSDSVVNVG